MFDTPDFQYAVYGSQVYSGTEANPVFSVGTFRASSEADFPGQGESYCQSRFCGKLTISSVPEPGTLFAGALGLLGVALTLRRRARGPLLLRISSDP